MAVPEVSYALWSERLGAFLHTVPIYVPSSKDAPSRPSSRGAGHTHGVVCKLGILERTIFSSQLQWL